MKYYAVFSESEGQYAVKFPDLQCHTCGDDMEEAYDMAVDALAGYLAHAEPQFVKEPSPYEAIRKHFPDYVIMAVPVDHKIKAKYEKRVRVNVSLPAVALARIDEAAKKAGLNRSEFFVNSTIRMIESVDCI